MSQPPANNVVLIGKKPTMNYVIACLTLFNSGAQEVVVRARGRAISSAVDTVQLLRKGFVKNLDVRRITIGTDEFLRSEGDKSTVSTIEIVCSKPGR